MLQSLGSCLPEDIETERVAVLKFSKQLQKQLTTKFASLEELKEVKEKASAYWIQSPEMAWLGENVIKTEEWL